MENESDVTGNPVRNLGKVQKFIVGADFEAYAEPLDFFFVANGVTDSKQKKAVLLTNLPTETYQLAKDLMAPILLREDSLTYDTIVKRLQKQLKPQKSALVARYEFDNRQLTFDNAVAKCIAIEQSYKDVEALQRGKEANPVDLLSKSKLSKKPTPKKEKSPEKRGPPPPLKSWVIEVATTVWEIMIIKVVRFQRRNVTTVTRLPTLQGLAKP